jgi:hypothetical protein
MDMLPRAIEGAKKSVRRVLYTKERERGDGVTGKVALWTTSDNPGSCCLRLVRGMSGSERRRAGDVCRRWHTL